MGEVKRQGDGTQVILSKEDLGIIIKTKNEKFWDDVKEQAEKEIERLEQGIKFNKAVLLKNLTFEKFVKAVKEGIIVYDIRIGVYRSGKNKGKTHDHGSGFRVMKNNFDKVFDIEEI